MKSVFIDSDILLDVILNRQPFYFDSVEILKLIETQKYVCYTSVHSILNVHYLAKKSFGEKATRQAIKVLTGKLDIITEDEKLVEQALDSAFTDFEDAVQYYAAERINADAIITRNIKDYKLSKIPVYTAEQFLRIIL